MRTFILAASLITLSVIASHAADNRSIADAAFVNNAPPSGDQ
jgi:hypothetical protein